VVPVAILGSYQVRNWKRLQFPRVSVSYGEPVRFDVIENPTRDQQQRAADLILDRIRELHAELQRAGSARALWSGRPQPVT
jgi:1-acyl-sn-glycerol-3-phosphate acyltransferase